MDGLYRPALHWLALFASRREVRAKEYRRMPIAAMDVSLAGQTVDFPQAESTWGTITHFVIFAREKGGRPVRLCKSSRQELFPAMPITQGTTARLNLRIATA